MANFHHTMCMSLDQLDTKVIYFPFLFALGICAAVSYIMYRFKSVEEYEKSKRQNNNGYTAANDQSEQERSELD